MNFSIITMGCKVNSYESEAIRERLLKQGFNESSFFDADYIFINTCAVTNEAERKDLQKVRSINRKYPQAKIVVMGCSSQIHKERYLEIENVITVIGNSFKSKVECLINEENKDFVNLDSRHFVYEDTPISKAKKEVRAYVKIQDGCDNFCSYCVVPFTRGNSRCRDHYSILKECKDLIDSNAKELVIGGIDCGCYKDPNDSTYTLTSLLKDIIKISDKPYRIRVSSIEESQITDEYIELFRDHQDKLCKHFHLPLQSGCEKTLRRMNRKYSLDNYLKTVDKIKKAIPFVALSTDVITGFPGESEEDFMMTYSFCKKVGFMRIHAFPYSERPFTMASKLKDVIDMKVRMNRVKELIELSNKEDIEFRNAHKGETVNVLIEEKNREGFYSGYSENYLRFNIESDKDIRNTFYPIKIC